MKKMEKLLESSSLMGESLKTESAGKINPAASAAEGAKAASSPDNANPGVEQSEKCEIVKPKKTSKDKHEEQANLVTFSRQKLALIQSEYDPKCCNSCEKATASMKRCTKCKTAFYCSKECQVKDWKMKHKAHCKEIRRLKEIISPQVMEKQLRATIYGQEWDLPREVSFYPHMDIMNKIQIVTGTSGGGHPLSDITLHTLEGFEIDRHSFLGEVLGLCVCYLPKKRYIAVSCAFSDYSRDENLLYRIDFYTPSLERCYSYDDEEYGDLGACDLGALNFYKGRLFVASYGHVKQFDVSDFPIKPYKYPIVLKTKVKNMLCMEINGSDAISIQHEDEEGYYSMSCIDFSGQKLWQLGGRYGIGVDDRLFLPDGICTDSKGHIFAADPGSMRVVVVHRDLRLQSLFYAPGRVWCVKWCEATEKLHVLHINPDRTGLQTVVLDVTEV